MDWVQNTQKLDWQLKDEQKKSSWLDFYQKMPWSPFVSRVAGAVGRGIQKLPEVLEKPEVERWIRPGAQAGAILWAPKYGFEGGKPTPETLKAYTEFAREHPEIKNPADFFKAMWDVASMYGTKSIMGKQYEEKVPLGATAGLSSSATGHKITAN